MHVEDTKKKTKHKMISRISFSLLSLNIMNRNLRNLTQPSNNVLPLCYSLAINPNNPVNKLLLSTDAIVNAEQQQKQQSLKKSIEENPYYSKYAEKIKKAQLSSSSSLTSNDGDKKIESPEKKPSTTIVESVAEDCEKLKSEINTIKGLNDLLF